MSNNASMKIVNLLNVLFSVVILILECLPHSMVKSIRIDEDMFITSYHSYFASPSDWNLGLTFAFIVAILTIVVLIIDIFLLLKSIKSMRIASIVLSLVLWIFSIFMAQGEHATVFNVLILALFTAQATDKLVVILFEGKQVASRKAALLDLISPSLIAVAMFFELIPDSVKIVSKYNYNGIVDFSNTGFSYLFRSGDNRLTDIAFVVALLTICAFVISLVTLVKNKKWMAITTLSISSICAILSVVILSMAGRSVTPSNVIVLISFLGLIVAQSLRLKNNFWSVRNEI